MKREILAATILSILSTSPAFADGISGGARADFGSRALIVPCVQVVNSDDEAINGQFYDVVLNQRGKSLNYEVVLGEPEDSETCMAAIEAMLENDEDTDDIDGDATDITDDEDSDDEDSDDEDSDDEDSDDEDSDDEDSTAVNKGKENNKK